ncbi:AMP-binding protein [Burkholderia sp. FERM BP-3421]|uniref:AMP-binding protein n=1 Tax=Burkholderia sp. FERM BP-3421 TaxID=1494466 RepID=UPI0023624198|nr:AMP-binding protein [Burkholderia sp. FERM BP-3421]WDD90810.1 AMP-binding protein [Burkholderia sp. FERM BP-3421]
MDDESVTPPHRTIIERLRHWAATRPDRPAYTFLKERAQFERGMTFGELGAAVDARAADVRARGLAGRRVMLMQPSGLDYIVDFLGCLAAGAVAVPMYPPSTQRDWDKLAAVIGNCRPSALIVDAKTIARHGDALRAQLGLDAGCSVLTGAPGPSPMRASDDDMPPLESASLAFLQYTSGSTGTPKGVMVSHGNILLNARQQARAMRCDGDAVIVSWLPFYHDMGLIGMILQALSVGAHAVLMSPFSFLRNPSSWLLAISRYAGAIAGGPNFAFDLCVDKIDDAERAELDLGSWRVAFNGSEPVKASTLARFSTRFAPAGFRADAHFPCYGLAEATLYVSGGHADAQAVLSVARAPLGANRIVPAGDADAGEALASLVSVYATPAELDARIVDPATWKALPDGVVGEIWLNGRGVTGGYWQRPVETAETFRAYLADTGDGPFLRTGDLGCVRDGRLYITGRIKELLIVNGVNYYPQDLEDTVQALGDLYRAHSGAAFLLEDGGLAIVQGLNRAKLDPEAMRAEIGRVRRAIWEGHGLAAASVVFVQPGEIAKTSSGKIQRDLMRRRLAAGELAVLAQWRETDDEAAGVAVAGAEVVGAVMAGAVAADDAIADDAAVDTEVTGAAAADAATVDGAAAGAEVLEAAMAGASIADAAAVDAATADDAAAGAEVVGAAATGASAAHAATTAPYAEHTPEAPPAALSPRARALIEWLDDYVPRCVNSLQIDERRCIPPNIVLDFGNRGLLGMLAPREAGGLGFGTTDFTRVVEVLGAKDMTLALFVGLNNALGIRPLAKHGGAASRARHLAALATGRELAAFALTEPGAGSNPGAIAATARRLPDGRYRINGTKYWSGSAAWAGVIHVFAKTLDADGQVTGVTGFAIPAASPGVVQGPEALTMGMRGMIQNTVRLDGVIAQADQVLGEPDHGMAVAQDTMCYGRLAIAALCVGAMKTSYQLMLRYAGRREISTGPLLANPHARDVLTETMRAIRALERLVRGVAERVDAGARVAPELLAACKCLSTEWLGVTIDRTLQLAGGRGYIETNLIPQIFRDARIFRIFEGPTEALHHFLGATAARAPEALRAHLSAGLRDEAAVARHFDAALAAARVAAEADAGDAHWRHQATGAYLAELVLYAAGAAQARDDAAARAWFDARLDAARRTLDGASARLARLASVDALRDYGASLDGEIGVDRRRAAQPAFECDPLLAPDAPASLASAVVSPASHSTPPPSILHPARRDDGLRAAPLGIDVTAARPRAPQPAALRAGADAHGEIRDFIVGWIAARCKLAPQTASADLEFAMFGLGSIDSTELAESLSSRFSLDLDPTVLWNYPTPRQLAAFIHHKLPSGFAARAPQAALANGQAKA